MMAPMYPRSPLADIDRALVALLQDTEPTGPLPPERRVFVNRHLRLDSIHAIGFDLDYTLAVYRKEPMETAQFQMTLERLVNTLGYPREVLDLKYNPALVIRGLVVDKKLGNLLKMNAHDHVCRAHHGRRPLTRDERHTQYRTRRIRLSGTRYASLDTLFSIPEAALYTALVDYFDQRRAIGLDIYPLAERDGSVSYEKLFVDVRESIDTIHRDGSLKNRIRPDIAGYLERDPELSTALHKLRSSGKRLFLLTNSAWEYTNDVMSFLLDGVAPEYPTWRRYFDLIVVDAGKPSFFTERTPFLVLDDNGAARGTVTRGRFDRTTVYARGNIHDFERLAQTVGDQVLYVGDHIYGDILRSKKDSLWRTALITEEIEVEVARLVRDRAEHERLAELDHVRQRLDDEINQSKTFLARVEAATASARSPSPARRYGPSELQSLETLAHQVRARLDTHKRALREVGQQLEELDAAIDRHFNATWGRVFKEGHELSRYGSQVEEYACIYTSRVTNFAYYSPLEYFRTPRDLMPHERSDILPGDDLGRPQGG